MKLKKINAVLGLLSAAALLIHIGYTIYAYLTLYYNPVLKLLTAIPQMVLICLHAVCGMAAVFLQSDGTRMDLYPKQNLKTIIQRLTAALILPLLFLHIKTYDLLRSSAEGGQWLAFALLMLSQPLFYADVLAHASLSLSRSLISLGWLSSREGQVRLDRIAVAVGAVVFAITVFAVVKGQLAMFVK
jgi:hypothetical protein